MTEHTPPLDESLTMPDGSPMPHQIVAFGHELMKRYFERKEIQTRQGYLTGLELAKRWGISSAKAMRLVMEEELPAYRWDGGEIVATATFYLSHQRHLGSPEFFRALFHLADVWVFEKALRREFGFSDTDLKRLMARDFALRRMMDNPNLRPGEIAALMMHEKYRKLWGAITEKTLCNYLKDLPLNRTKGRKKGS